MRTRSGLTAGQVAELVGGELHGPHDVPLAGVASLEEAGPGDLSFLTSARYLSLLSRTHAGAVLLGPGYQDVEAGAATRIVVDDPTGALARAIAVLYPETSPVFGVDPTARIGRGTRWGGRVAIGPRATLGANVRLGTGCVIGAHAIVEDEATLGDDCRIGPLAVVHAGVTLGDRVVLQAGARVGNPGFRFLAKADGHERVRHIGRCVIGDEVEIGANSTVDQGSVAATVVGSGTKIDNLVQIGHNVRIGARCLIMAQVGIGGSAVLEDDVILAGQAGIADHLTVGRGARVAAQSGVIGNVPPSTTVSGYPARSHRTVLRQSAALSRLSPLVTSIERLVARSG